MHTVSGAALTDAMLSGVGLGVREGCGGGSRRGWRRLNVLRKQGRSYNALLDRRQPAPVCVLSQKLCVLGPVPGELVFCALMAPALVPWNPCCARNAVA